MHILKVHLEICLVIKDSILNGLKNVERLSREKLPQKTYYFLAVRVNVSLKNEYSKYPQLLKFNFGVFCAKSEL